MKLIITIEETKEIKRLQKSLKRVLTLLEDFSDSHDTYVWSPIEDYVVAEAHKLVDKVPLTKVPYQWGDNVEVMLQKGV